MSTLPEAGLGLLAAKRRRILFPFRTGTVSNPAVASFARWLSTMADCTYVLCHCSRLRTQLDRIFMDWQVHNCYTINGAGYSMNWVHHIHMQLKPLFVQVIIQVSGGKEKERQGWEEDLASSEV